MTTMTMLDDPAAFHCSVAMNETATGNHP